MGQIVLVRHGQASFGADDYDDLSPLGRDQAVLAGRVLKDRRLRDPLLAHGTLRRQRDTAELVASAMGLEAGAATVHPGFDEYDFIGMVADRIPQESEPLDAAGFQRILDVALHEWVSADTADGWRAFDDGAWSALTSVAEAIGSGRDAVVVTSGGVIAALCGRLLGLGADGLVALNRVLVNTSFTTVIVGSQGLSLLSVNDHAHLTGLAAALRTYR